MLEPISSSQWCYILERSLSSLLQSHSYRYPTDQDLGGISTHVNLWIPAQVLRQFLRDDAFTWPPSIASENETLVNQNDTAYFVWMIPGPDLDQFLQSYEQPASWFLLSVNGQDIPIGQNGAPLHSIPAESLIKFLQPYAIQVTESPLSRYENEAPAERQLDDDGEDVSMSMSDMSSQSQDSDQVNAKTHEASPCTSHECRVCQRTFLRPQERNRHIETHLPHSLLCSYQGCIWTGRRLCEFKEHWRKKHTLANAGEVPEDADADADADADEAPEDGDADEAPEDGGADEAPKDANKLYDAKHFVKLIVDGALVEGVARYAFAEVQKKLGRLGKQHANVWGRNGELKVWGRNEELKEWISSLDPNLTAITAFDTDL